MQTGPGKLALAYLAIANIITLNLTNQPKQELYHVGCNRCSSFGRRWYPDRDDRLGQRHLAAEQSKAAVVEVQAVQSADASKTDHAK